MTATRPAGAGRVRAALSSRVHRTWAAVGAAAAALVAALIFAQPVGSPWWLYADSDAVYVGSGLNLAGGHHTRFFDHPGLPLQQLFAATSIVRAAVAGESPRSYADRQLLDLGATKPYFRAYAILFYFAGAALAFLLLGRLLGGPLWGAAGVLLWIGAPGILPMAIQYRADPLVTLLALAVGVLAMQAVRTRDAAYLAAAAVLTGFAVTLKYSAILLLVPLVIAAFAGRPRAGGDVSRRRALSLLARHRLLLAALVAAWAVAAAILNWSARSFVPNRKQFVALIGLLALVALYSALARLVRRFPLDWFGALLVSSLAIGLLLPVTLTVEDGLQMLIWLGRDFTGSGPTDDGLALGGFAWHAFDDFPLWPTIPVFVLALIAGVLAIRRRDAGEFLLGAGTFLGLLVLGTQLKRDYYLAPVYMLAAPAALLLLRRLGRRLGAVAALALGALLLGGQLAHLFHGRDSARAGDEFAASATADARAVIPPSDLILALAGQPLEDTRYFEFVQAFVNYTPPYPYRFLSVTPEAHAFAAAHGLEPAWLMQGATTTFDFSRRVLIRATWTDYRVAPRGPAGPNGFRFLPVRRLLP